MAESQQSDSDALNAIFQRLGAAESFARIMPEIEPAMLAFLQAERITVYQKGRQDREIVSRYMTEGKTIQEIRLPLTASSIAGFVAMSQRSLRIDDVYDSTALAAIHPNLHFDRRFDKQNNFRTRSMMVVPIKSGDVLLGVMQVINRSDGGGFTELDLIHAQQLARVLGHKFRNEFQITLGPFDLLIQQGKLTSEKLLEFKQRAAKSRATVDQLLIQELRLTPEEIGASLEQYYQVPFMRHDPNTPLPRELLKTLSESYLRRQFWVPVAGDSEKAVILIDDPSDAARIMEIQNVLNVRSYEIRVGLRDDILRYLKGLSSSGGGGGADGGGGDINALVGAMEGEADDLSSDADEEDGVLNEKEPIVIKLVNQIIVEAHRLGGSDIHIEPSKGKLPAMVRLRVDGSCRAMLQIPASHIKAVIARIKIMSRLDISERRRPQDGKCVVKIGGNSVELRVATIPTVNGEGAVLRVLAAGGALPFTKLNLSERNATEIEKLITRPHGIFLVVGPTGSGKTTTLHAVLGHINTPDRKIWTAEDPVEITQPGMCQVQVDRKIGFDFAAALRSFLRADPDVILIGEMRDKETAHSGIEASLTGHMVFSTLHTNSAPETITRLLDLGLDPMNFADALQGVLAQRLLRTLCGKCKEPYRPNEEEFERLRHLYGEQHFPELGVSPESLELFRPKGCPACDQTGYKGRTGIHELLVATDELRKLVAAKAGIDELREKAQEEGMRTVLQDGVAKVIRGQSDLIQLRKVAAEK